MPPTLKRFELSTPELNRLQENLARSLDPLSSMAILGGVLLEGVELLRGPNDVPHRLGRAPRGWWTARKHGASPDAWHDGDLSGFAWTNFGTPYSNAGYTIDSEGWVHLRGLVTGGVVAASALGTIFTLPVGYRPTESIHFPVVSNGAFGIVFVNTAGQVWAHTGSNVYFQLDGVRFRADASDVAELVEDEASNELPDRFLRLISPCAMTADLWVY